MKTVTVPHIGSLMPELFISNKYIIYDVPHIQCGFLLLDSNNTCMCMLFGLLAVVASISRIKKECLHLIG